ncbi:MAG: phosphonate ABC transporter substrate-binding protein [Rhodospirillaceae bacterium]|nr:phosphonate ABC transporter substrate-binding protein [Rhodospirillaceae bacterium]
MRSSVAALGMLAASAFADPAMAAEEMPDKINFGIIATVTTQALKAEWQPVLDDMEKALGIEVEGFFATDYAGIIEAMRFGKVQVAWFGNKSAIEAVDRAGAEVFAQTSGLDSDGNLDFGYYSLLITHADNTELNALADVIKCDQSLDFGNGDPNSTSGFLVPSYYVFAANDIDPKFCYKTVRNANHGVNLMSVVNKQVDFVTNNTEDLARFRQQQPELAEKIKIIWTSPMIPKDPITYRADLPKELKAQIKVFFLGYGRMGDNIEQARANLKAFSGGSWLFFDSSNALLYPIRELGYFKEKLNVEQDDNLSAEEKKKRLTEIEKKLEIVRVLAKYQGAITVE